MSTIIPVSAVDASVPATVLSRPATAVHSAGRADASFANLLMDGVHSANTKLLEAEQLVTAFASGDNIPVHKVSYAIEVARQSLEMSLQVRNRLLEAYQQFMNMQI